MLPTAFVLALLTCGPAYCGYTPPPVGLVLHGTFKSGARVYLSNHDFRGYASYDLGAREVRLEWTYRVAGLEDGPMLADRSRWKSRQIIGLTSFPTDVVGTGEDRIAVAAVTPGGRVVVDVFELLEVPTPGQVVHADGRRTVPEVTVPVRAGARIFEDDVTTFGEIAYLFPNLGLDGHLFLQAHGSGDLFDLDMATGQVQRAAGARTAHAGLPWVPELAGAWTDAGSGTHLALGHLYWFSRSTGGCNPPGQTLMLRDANEDGFLDGWTLNPDWGDKAPASSWAPRTTRR